MSDGIAFPNRFNAWTLSASFSTQTMTTKMKIIVSTLILGLAITSVGLLQKTTHKQSKKMETADSTHSEEWEFYFKNLDNKVASIYVDLGFHKIAPIKDQPNVVWVSIKMNNPSEDGLSSNKESNQLFKIEDALVDKLKARFNSIYVGRVTSTGIRKLYFYFGDTLNYNKVISEAISIFPKYHFDFGSKEDKEWSNYLDSLYPNPRQFQRITNRRVVEQLEKGGDKLIKARERYWQDFYDAIGPSGLNCKLTPVGEQKGVFSEETKQRISKATVGRPSWNKGTRGRKYPPRSETHLQNLRKPKSKEAAARMAEGHKKPILDTESGIVYPSRKDAAIQLHKSPGAITYHLKRGLFKFI